MAKISIYRTYQFVDKDPIIDKVKTMIQDERLFGQLGTVGELSGVSTSTLNNWFHGPTKRPQHATVAAVSSSLGYEMGFKKIKPIDIERELAVAARWYEKQADVAPRKMAAARRSRSPTKTS